MKLWGSQSWLQPPFRRLFNRALRAGVHRCSRQVDQASDRAGAIAARRSRLKGGCSQDWLPHALLLGCVLIAGACGSPKPQVKSEAPPEYFKVDPATAAKVHGTVRFLGKKPAAKTILMNAEEACEKLHDKPVHLQSVLTDADRNLANAFVYIKSGLEGKTFEPPKEAVVLDQKGCMFVPRVMAIRAGQTLNVKNSDPVSHNIHPVPQNNREWNQQQSPGAPDLLRRFARAEAMIPVKCNVHSWMRSFIGVMEHPYFAVTGADGRFEWSSVPPGDYTVAVWHETLGELTEKITLSPKAEQDLKFAFKSAP
jgi:plastocyanin